MRAVGIEKISVCCRRHGSWARSPDPHPIAQFPYPQSAMDRWFGEGGGAQPVCSAPQQPALLGLHWRLLLVNYRGPSLAGSRNNGPSHNYWCVTRYPHPPILLHPHKLSHPSVFCMNALNEHFSLNALVLLVDGQPTHPSAAAEHGNECV